MFDGGNTDGRKRVMFLPSQDDRPTDLEFDPTDRVWKPANQVWRPNTFRCPHCGRHDFESNASRTRHINVHHDGQKFPLEIEPVGRWRRAFRAFRSES